MVSLRRFFSAVLPLVLVAAVQGAVLLRPGDNTFCRTVLENFNSWDADSNGEISSQELDKLAVDGSITGVPAAAIGALKSFDRSSKVDLPPLTRGFFTDRQATIAAGKRVTPGLEERFSRTLRRITTAQRKVFGSGGPTLETCRQGSLGDCYFVAMVGAAVQRDAAEVRRMIEQDEDGTYVVKFPGHEVVRVPPLTDASLALTSSGGADGLWLPVLEKAYGTIRNESLPESKQSEEPTDAIARGGSTGPVIRLLTGHATDRLTFRAYRDNSEHRMEEELAKLRQRIKTAVSEKRLIGLATPPEGTPPGVTAKHAYAVLGYDEKKDTVRVWNPHGNRFRPKADEGIKNGYTTRNGLFDVPLKDMVQVFTGMTIETERAAGKERPRPTSGSGRRPGDNRR